MININPERKKEILAEQARRQRDSLLSQCDWTQTMDQPTHFREKWHGYRQALRDISNQAGFPENIEWPDKPE